MRRAFVREAPHSRTKLNVESMRRAFRVALPFDTQQECRHERANVQHCSPFKSDPGRGGNLEDCPVQLPPDILSHRPYDV